MIMMIMMISIDRQIYMYISMIDIEEKKDRQCMSMRDMIMI